MSRFFHVFLFRENLLFLTARKVTKELPGRQCAYSIRRCTLLEGLNDAPDPSSKFVITVNFLGLFVKENVKFIAKNH
jgi:hypothetical protein